MHKEQLSFVTMTPYTDFLITSSMDGIVKFWKKMAVGVEFVKEFRAHPAEIKSVSVSADGRSFATAGADKTIKIFDVITFDLLAMLSLDFTPRCVCWVHPRGASLPLLAVTDENSPMIQVFDGRGENTTPLNTVKSIHRSPVAAIAFNNAYDCVISADQSGMIEYWRASDGSYEKPDNVFELKSSTNLFDFKKSKSAPASITISPSGEQFATVSFPDRQVRVFDFATGKLYRKYDESLTPSPNPKSTSSSTNQATLCSTAPSTAPSASTPTPTASSASTQRTNPSDPSTSPCTRANHKRKA
jgi:peptidylprolyl isomerase domain and WD repeat-containing protein 1